jgi:hypothetical protein
VDGSELDVSKDRGWVFNSASLQIGQDTDEWGDLAGVWLVKEKRVWKGSLGPPSAFRKLHLSHPHRRYVLL